MQEQKGRTMLERSATMTGTMEEDQYQQRSRMKASWKGTSTGGAGWGLTATPHEGGEDSRGRVASDTLQQLQLGRIVLALVV